jgi:flavin-dependent dehydrogenase
MVSDVPVDEMLFQTYSDLLGFLWYFPRSDHVSVGIGTRVNAVPLSELWRRLDGFLRRHYPRARKVHRWRALIPNAISHDFWRKQCAGQNWALIGDAAGHVEAVTGIGIPYALASSTLVARAILCGDLQSYDRAWREQYGDRLEQSSRIMERFIRTGDAAGFERGMEEMCLATICPWLSALVK